MPWFAAHAVLYAKFKEGPQSEFQVWENVYLIEAASDAEAWAVAEVMGRRGEGDSQGSFTCDDRPAELVFAGVRKIIEVSHESADSVLGSGDEITYSQFALPTLAAVHKLAEGHEVELRYEE